MIFGLCDFYKLYFDHPRGDRVAIPPRLAGEESGEGSRDVVDYQELRGTPHLGDDEFNSYAAAADN